MGIHLQMLTNVHKFYPYTERFPMLSVLFSLDFKMKSQKGHDRFDTETVGGLKTAEKLSHSLKMVFQQSKVT